MKTINRVEIRSDRINLQLLIATDLELYKSIYCNEALMKYICPAVKECDIEKYFNQTLSQHKNNNPNHVLYVIRALGNSNKIGVIGLRWNQANNNSVEIGVIITEKHHRNGFAHEAKERIIKYAFKKLGIVSIVAFCDFRNTAANAANAKLGFKKHKTILKDKNNRLTVKWLLKNENKT